MSASGISAQIGVRPAPGWAALRPSEMSAVLSLPFRSFCELAPGCSRRTRSFFLPSSSLSSSFCFSSSSPPLPFSSILSSNLSLLTVCFASIGLMDLVNGAEGAPLAIDLLPAGQKARHESKPSTHRDCLYAVAGPLHPSLCQSDTHKLSRYGIQIPCLSIGSS